ncbi:MAG: hypothetical protein HXX18_00170 [Bacteroidetes bacterium]|nr:hypothetical protein [Bacteroidota bacterium]
MNFSYLAFVKKLLVFFIIICGLTATCFFSLPELYLTPVLPFLLPFFFSITLLTHYMQLKASQKSFARFTSGFMMITFLKLMILIALLLLYVLTHRKDAIPFIIWYFIFYVCFTTFEVINLQHIANKKEQ